LALGAQGLVSLELLIICEMNNLKPGGCFTTLCHLVLAKGSLLHIPELFFTGKKKKKKNKHF